MYASALLAFSALTQFRIPCLGNGATHGIQLFPPQIMQSTQPPIHRPKDKSIQSKQSHTNTPFPDDCRLG